MASSMFAQGIDRLHNARIDWDGHTIKALLVLSSYDSTPQFDTHDFLDDVPAADRAAANPRVAAITAQSTIVGNSDEVQFDHNAASISFSTVTTGQKIGGIVVFKSSGGDATSPLICYNKLSAVVDSDGGTFTVNFNAAGIFKASY